MKKILISWLAVQNDFKANGTLINEEGPTVNFHAFHYSHDEHILLYTPDYEDNALMIYNYIKKHFTSNRIVLQQIDITGVHKNLTIIKNKVETILLENSDKEIDILLSTGTGIMKIAWYICHTTLGLNTHILQILRKEESRDFFTPDILELNIKKSNTPFSAIIREQNISKTTKESDILICNSVKEQYDKAFKIAQADRVSVLITGKTGTGKEILAQYIHENSPRKNKTFITVNCAAFNDQLLESRLFGHKKGSFTGAYSDFKGFFEEANNGTIFLDEIGDISPYMQQALLRFLQEKEIQPIGGKTKKVDVRVIAATNKNIHNLIKNEKFRPDLFYRLGVIIDLPSFNDYFIEDKEKWINFLLEKKQKEFKRKTKLHISEKLYNFLISYSFAGNIRELINIIDNFYIFQEKEAGIKDLPINIAQNNAEISLNLQDIEKAHISKVLKLFSGNKTKTKNALGISLNTLKSKIEKYNI